MKQKLAPEQIRDLIAIERNPGIYSKCPPPSALSLYQIVEGGLATWLSGCGGYEITAAGRAALREAKEQRP